MKETFTREEMLWDGLCPQSVSLGLAAGELAPGCVSLVATDHRRRPLVVSHLPAEVALALASGIAEQARRILAEAAKAAHGSGGTA